MRMHLFNNKKIKKIKFIIIIILIILMITVCFKLTFNVFKALLAYAKTEVERISTVIINDAVDDKVLTKSYNYDLYSIVKNDNDEIEMIDYNAYAVNVFLNDVTTNIQNELIKYTNKGIVFYVPLGIISNNVLFNNLGPKIPVKLKLIGSVLTNINVKVTDYGINNALIEMNIFIEVKQKVILPFVSDDIYVTNEIPVSYKIISGKIPSYYGNSLLKDSNLYSIPLE